MKPAVTKFANEGVFVGTSSWKYRGWRDMLYDEARYVWRGKFAESRFKKNCLTEYAEVFKTVCVDGAYYKFPERLYLENLAAQVPSDFLFGFKVTDEITIKRFKNIPRYAACAGEANKNFLNADLFAESFLSPCESIRQNVGVLIFEFSRFSSGEYEHGRDFVADLDKFFSRLPKGWPYAVEMRNAKWLQGDYFACLAAHGVTHLFNSWDAMPPVADQMALPCSRTNPDLMAARLLLKPNRKYEEAVKMFSPYDRVLEINEGARTAGAALIKEGLTQPKRKTFLFVNNRLEGNALETIAGILEKINTAEQFKQPEVLG
jgi:uncharacterized protein YecE (DUF72 family)